MTEREELVSRAVLETLRGSDKPLGEPLLQALVQNRLGIAISVAELGETLRWAERHLFATGLPGANDRMKWSLSDKGRHHLANLANE